MKIGNFTTKNDIFLAPMAGFSDVGFRYVAKKYGAGLTVTEMVSAKGLVYGNSGSEALLATAENEDIKVVQLFGAESDFVAKASTHVLLEKFDIIDINMGCPVPKIVGNGEGSCMLRDSNNAAKVVKAVLETAKKPVTVKMRIGIIGGENPIDFAIKMEEIGVSAITVHGRTREEMYHGEPHYDVIREIKKALSIPVIANGNVVDKESFERIKAETMADGVMIGRGALGNPYIFSTLQGIACDRCNRENIEEQIQKLLKVYPSHIVANLMKKHIGFYLKGVKGVSMYREMVNSVNTLSALYDVLNTIDF